MPTVNPPEITPEALETQRRKDAQAVNTYVICTECYMGAGAHKLSCSHAPKTSNLVSRLREALRSRTWVNLPEDIEEAAYKLERYCAALLAIRNLLRSDPPDHLRAIAAIRGAYHQANNALDVCGNLFDRPTDETTPRLGMDTPWPLHDVLAKLVNAAHHLLDSHGCDQHGHEEIRTAAIYGQRYVEQLSAVETSPKPTHPNPIYCTCPACGGVHSRVTEKDVERCKYKPTGTLKCALWPDCACSREKAIPGQEPK